MTPEEALVVLKDHCCEISWTEASGDRYDALCGGPYLCAFRRIGSEEMKALDVLETLVREASR